MIKAISGHRWFKDSQQNSLHKIRSSFDEKHLNFFKDVILFAGNRENVNFEFKNFYGGYLWGLYGFISVQNLSENANE